MSVAYLCDRDLIERKNNIKAVNKFKKHEKIYKEILNILADSSNGDIAYKFNDGNNTLVEVLCCKRVQVPHHPGYCIRKETCNAGIHLVLKL